MPRRNDIQKILVIGSGPIVIGQSAEFDYSGTQACKALKQEGYEVVLVNSNPATIMTDPDLADRTYIEPLTREYVEEIIRLESEMLGAGSGKFALLPTVGGQTALNLAVDLADAGILDKYNVELIGAKLEAIKKAEDRLLFKDAMLRIGLDVSKSALVNNLRDGLEFASKLGFPVLIRPSFTLGGTGGGIAYNREELMEILARGLDLSPVHECLIEESVLGWKEYELEVMRDLADNVIIICSIENFDPMGVHTGDSITVAPAQTLTDREYQKMRDAAIAVMREIGVETGGSNVQFAVNPIDGRMTVIEMNPRVSRSSALASKATGFPIAKIAAKLAVGYTLDEIPNDITRKTPACFEPTIDYVVTKIPKWQFEKFPGSDETLGPQMKSVGEVMCIGRTFKESLMKAWRALETGKKTGAEVLEPRRLTQMLVTPRPERLSYIRYAFERGMSVREVARLTGMDPWFLHQLREVVLAQSAIVETTPETIGTEQLRQLKRFGLSDERIAAEWKLEGHAGTQQVRELRESKGIKPVFKLVDTCAAEFESMTPYLYSTYDEEDEAPPTQTKVIILGSGPNRIGQGIEFDYCCCHAAFALKDDGYETIMVNCNPETVSTDYDTSDRLYFEPLVLEDVLAIYNHESQTGAEIGMIVQFGGQTPLNLAQRFARPACPSSALRQSRSIWLRIASASANCSTSCRFRSQRAAPQPASMKRWPSVSASAIRCWSGRVMCLAAGPWSLLMTLRPSLAICARQSNTLRSGQCSSITSWKMPSRSMSMRSATPRTSSSPASCSTLKRPASTPAIRPACCLLLTFARAHWKRCALIRASSRWRSRSLALSTCNSPFSATRRARITSM